MVDYVTKDGPIFHKIFNMYTYIWPINQKLCGACGEKLVWVVSTVFILGFLI